MTDLGLGCVPLQQATLVRTIIPLREYLELLFSGLPRKARLMRPHTNQCSIKQLGEVRFLIEINMLAGLGAPFMT